MVGSLNKEGKPTALIKVDKLLYQVQAGNYLGQNYGRIVAINETSVQLREIVHDPAGTGLNAPHRSSCRRRRKNESA
jgi:type IV pilus assembly protein PilP